MSSYNNNSFFLLLLVNLSFTEPLAQSAGEGISFEVVSLFNSSQNPTVACYRIPAIAKAPNNDVLVAVDERVPSCGDLKWSKDINIVLRRSTDNGNTWSDIKTIVDYPLGQSASDPSFIVDEITNTIWLFYNFMDHSIGKNIYFLHTMYSVDNGHSWSKPKDITKEISKPKWHNDFKFITSGRGIQTREGKLLHCLVNLEKGTHVFGSDDHGKSWYLVDTPLQPANESKIVELSNGSWMVNSRVNGQPMRFVHRSEDNGKSWLSVPDTTLIDPNCNASIITYSIGDHSQDLVLFSNAASKENRENLTIKISRDEGLTWSIGTQVYSESSAYSTMAVLHNNDVGLVFEKDNYGEIVFVKLDKKMFYP